MCTVTYIPLQSGTFVFTSNRDESPKRSPDRISTELRAGQQLLFPKDTMAGGTWIAVSNAQRLACVLNGAFVRHRHSPPYRMSRGVMLLKYFEFDDWKDFVSGFSFEGIEPFTMLIVENGQPIEIRWDGVVLHQKVLDPYKPAIWSSATLYDPEIQNRRRGWFDEWILRHPNPTAPEIFHFHLHGGEADPVNGFVMNRNGVVRTVSITQVVCDLEKAKMEYKDLLRGNTSREEINWRKNAPNVAAGC